MTYLLSIYLLQIHIGQGIEVTKIGFDNAVKGAKLKNSIFVKNMTVAVFTIEELKTHSPTGGKSNRVPTEQKPALNATRMMALQGI